MRLSFGLNETGQRMTVECVLRYTVISKETAGRPTHFQAPTKRDVNLNRVGLTAPRATDEEVEFRFQDGSSSPGLPQRTILVRVVSNAITLNITAAAWSSSSSPVSH